jgi:indole-3-glycerol phosphate synthase
MSILSDIAAYKHDEIAAAKAATPAADLEAQARDMTSPRGFLAALTRAKSAGRYALIAEIKRASPSKGLIRKDFDPTALARAYAKGGATCLSVLTDKPSFQGDLHYIGMARAASSLPILRKDFMFDPYQVLEARVAGADCILIIMAAVTDDEARALMEACEKWQLDWLIEVHNEAELERALALPSPLIGINNRDLNDFKTTLDVTFALAPKIPAGRIVVSESGIRNHDDLKSLAKASVTTYLVGESLMRENDVTDATRKLLTGRTLSL